eukprot:6565224-Prymnesium_polylepis.3
MAKLGKRQVGQVGRASDIMRQDAAELQRSSDVDIASQLVDHIHQFLHIVLTDFKERPLHRFSQVLIDD